MGNHHNNLAFVFPGQGSQSVGMLSDLALEYPEILQTYAEASSILGFDLWKKISEGPAESLNLTENTQPAMLAAGVAVYRLWCRLSEARPAWMAGHSLGEYSALVCAGSLAFEDAVVLVAQRARLMQGAVPAGVGAMAAILGLDDEKVAAVCADLSSEGELVMPANFNAPGQIVIAGHAQAVTRAIEAAKTEGAKKAVLLPMSVPSHCPLMAEAAERFREALDKAPVRSPQVSVVHNVDVAVYSSPEDIRCALAQQLCGAVRWTDSIRFLCGQGVDRIIESGPGKVLAGLNKRIAVEARIATIFNPDSLNKALELVA
ncbi:MAG: ACP S-malonyltransferase [Methylococcaceae bacterium]|nr:ACP S-malonyltransferase [Methylococcaceae bacterium]